MPEVRRQSGRTTEALSLDAVNLRLLAQLQANARLSLAELGRRVGLSSPAVAERLQRLEQEGVILGYQARLDPSKVGMTLSAVIRVRPAPRQLREVAELAQRTPEVVDCRRITGDGARHPLTAEPGGWWSSGPLLPGTRYRLSIDGGEAMPDPRSPWQPDGVEGLGGEHVDDARRGRALTY